MSKRSINLIVVFGFAFFLFPPFIQAQVTLTVGDGSGYRGSYNNPVGVSLNNPADRVKQVLVDVCDTDDYLDVLRCDTTSRSSDGFACQVISLPSGCARVFLSSPGGVIGQGSGDIFTLRYNVDSGAPGGQSRELSPQNVFITDEFGSSLTVTPVSGDFTFTSCSSGAQCNDGLYCNGDEGCSSGVCTHTGDPCPDTECESCQEDTNSCFEPEGVLCSDDGLYCNGDEICDGSGSCVHAGSPCPNATCVEGNDECTCNLPGESCDDGIYCNGEDICFAGVCEHPVDPCPGQGVGCNEHSDRCVCLIDSLCDDQNLCTDDSCGADGTCRNTDNTNSCDDGLYCNGTDVCDCGVCAHSGDPCVSPLVCYEGDNQCSGAQVTITINNGSGVIGTTGNTVTVSLSNPFDPVSGLQMKICDENDDLVVSGCTLTGRAAATNSSCSATEQSEDGCALVSLIPNTGDPQTISTGSGPIMVIEYDVGYCIERVLEGTCSQASQNPGAPCFEDDDCPGGTCVPPCTGCGGAECYQEGATCSPGSPDCYRFDPNKICNCLELDCYSLDIPCPFIDTGNIVLSPESVLVVVVVEGEEDIELGALSNAGQFSIVCDQTADCSDGNVCSIDSCSGGSCVRTTSGVQVCDDGLYCTDTDMCAGSECIGSGDTCAGIGLCREDVDQCDTFAGDTDYDGVLDASDNCVETPNGPEGGTCTNGLSGEPCLEHCDCGVSNGYCTMTQEDSYPPGGNNLGDACDCEGNFDCDEDVDGTDAQFFKTDFGRSMFLNPCTNVVTCNGDFDCDGDVDGSDAQVFKSDFGRSMFRDPCPSCEVSPLPPWCSYP